MSTTLPEGTTATAAPLASARASTSVQGSNVIALEQVTKIYRTGTISVAALRGVSLHHRPGRVRGHHRAIGIGQVHPDAHPRLPRYANDRHLPPGR